MEEPQHDLKWCLCSSLLLKSQILQPVFVKYECGNIPALCLAVSPPSLSQASEQDILKYVIKWGEHQLIRRMADRGEIAVHIDPTLHIFTSKYMPPLTLICSNDRCVVIGTGSC